VHKPKQPIAVDHDSLSAVDIALLNLGSNTPCTDHVLDKNGHVLSLFSGFQIQVRFTGKLFSSEIITVTIVRSRQGWATFSASSVNSSMVVEAATSAQDLWKQICVQMNVEYENIRSVPVLMGWRSDAITQHMQPRALQLPGQRTIHGYADFIGSKFIKHLPAKEYNTVSDLCKALGITLTIPDIQSNSRYTQPLKDFQKKRLNALVNSTGALVGWLCHVACPQDPAGLLDLIYGCLNHEVKYQAK
jgi:hypothetical protein